MYNIKPSKFLSIVSIKNKIRFLMLNLSDIPRLRVMKLTREKGLTYLDVNALADLTDVVISNEKKGVKGIIVEAGCALGGSAIAITSVKNRERDLFVYDIFGTIPPPSLMDGADARERYEVIASGSSQGIGTGKYYGYQENLYQKVIDHFQDFNLPIDENNVHLVKGLYQDTLQIDSPVSLAHIDCDWYDSVMCCLTKIEPYLSSGGTLVIDDYHAYSGCKSAVDEYFRHLNPNDYNFIYKNRLHIVKK
jgi:hypothetical protein